MTKPKIGLALGSGGARGMAHIGVLKVLEEHQIPVDFIAGSSMGSLVGALYANNLKPDMLEKLAVNIKRKHWLDMTVPTKTRLGFIHGGKIKELVRLLTQGKNIEDLSLPLALVATDIEKGEPVVFMEGPVDVAVRASIAIPGIFTPEQVGGRLLVDGGVIDRVPVAAVKEMGADIILAVDVSVKHMEQEIHSLVDVISQTIDVMAREIIKYRQPDADVVIYPELGNFSSVSFANIDKIIERGKQAAELSIDHIKEKIQKWEEWQN